MSGNWLFARARVRQECVKCAHHAISLLFSTFLPLLPSFLNGEQAVGLGDLLTQIRAARIREWSWGGGMHVISDHALWMYDGEVSETVCLVPVPEP